MAGVPARFTVGIERYDPGRDADDLAAFQLRMFGEGSRQVDRNRFRWLFEQNPYLGADGPGLWVCRRDGSLVGQQGEIPFDLQVGEQTRRAAWAIDLMVDPAWRLRGVGPGLIATQRQAHAIVAGLNISDKGQAAYRRAGWTDLGIVPVYVRPLRADRALGIAPVPERVRRLAPVAGPALRVADAALAGALRAAGGARLVAADRLDGRTDEVWRASGDHYLALARRDLHALSWRIDQRPDRDTLQRAYLVRRGQVLGYVVLRPTTWSGEPVAVVVDYLAPPRWVAPLLLLAGQRAAREQGAVALLAKTRNEPADRWLRAAGFVRRDQGADPPIRFMVHCTDDAGVCAVVDDPASWFVTSADSDLEYATTPGSGEGDGQA